MKQEEYVSEVTTVLHNSIWRIEVLHRTIDNEFSVVLGTKNQFLNNSEEVLSQKEFQSLLKVMEEANRIIERKESLVDNLQQKEI